MSLVQTVEWIPVEDRLPVVPTGCSRVLTVAYGKSKVAEAVYLNAMELYINDEYEDVTGWHLMRASDYFDEFFIPLEETVTHWAEPLKHPNDLT